tara:strand:- start:124 stop:1215 length:1092 start_codon:yes stop_codon:yes gene_type:complete
MVKKRSSKMKPTKSFFWYISHEKHLSFLFSLIFVLILISLFFLFQTTEEKALICNDGTLYDTCSLNKPYYCLNGILVEGSSVCSCPEIFNEKDNSCISDYHENSKQITLKYILEGNESEINLTVYEEMMGYVSEISRSIDYKGEEEPSRVDFKLKNINEEKQREFLLPLVVEIQNLVSDKNEQARIAISIVQNIPYGFSNKTSILSGKNSVNYLRYPYEVLYDFQGVCGEKSQLLSFLLKELGFKTAIFYNQQENHESVGIKCPIEERWKNTGYCFVETSGPSIITDTSITYTGGIVLESKPEVMKISNGFSLSRGLQEYEDAEDLMEINKKVRETKEINFLDNLKLEELKEKYGLLDEYNLF